MKGIVAICLKRLIQKESGLEKWYEILENSGIDKYVIINASDNIDDSTFMNIIDSTCEKLGISLEQVMDAFGDYWVNTYAPEVYKVYYKNMKTAKDFILNMNHVHNSVMANMENAKPPKFEFEWSDDKTLQIKYESDRNLLVLMIALLKGVGKYFNENLKIRKLTEDTVEVVFA